MHSWEYYRLWFDEVKPTVSTTRQTIKRIWFTRKFINYKLSYDILSFNCSELFPFAIRFAIAFVWMSPEKKCTIDDERKGARKWLIYRIERWRRWRYLTWWWWWWEKVSRTNLIDFSVLSTHSTEQCMSEY